MAAGCNPDNPQTGNHKSLILRGESLRKRFCLGIANLPGNGSAKPHCRHGNLSHGGSFVNQLHESAVPEGSFRGQSRLVEIEGKPLLVLTIERDARQELQAMEIEFVTENVLKMTYVVYPPEPPSPNMKKSFSPPASVLARAGPDGKLDDDTARKAAELNDEISGRASREPETQ